MINAASPGGARSSAPAGYGFRGWDYVLLNSIAHTHTVLDEFVGWVEGGIACTPLSIPRPKPNIHAECYNHLMEYRRVYTPGGTYFFTVVTYQRRPIFSSPDAVENLRKAFQYTLSRMPFTIVASS